MTVRPIYSLKLSYHIASFFRLCLLGRLDRHRFLRINPISPSYRRRGTEGVGDAFQGRTLRSWKIDYDSDHLVVLNPRPLILCDPPKLENRHFRYGST